MLVRLGVYLKKFEHSSESSNSVGGVPHALHAGAPRYRSLAWTEGLVYCFMLNLWSLRVHCVYVLKSLHRGRDNGWGCSATRVAPGSFE